MQISGAIKTASQLKAARLNATRQATPTGLPGQPAFFPTPISTARPPTIPLNRRSTPALPLTLAQPSPLSMPHGPISALPQVANMPEQPISKPQPLPSAAPLPTQPSHSPSPQTAKPFKLFQIGIKRGHRKRSSRAPNSSAGPPSRVQVSTLRISALQQALPLPEQPVPASPQTSNAVALSQQKHTPLHKPLFGFLHLGRHKRRPKRLRLLGRKKHQLASKYNRIN